MACGSAAINSSQSTPWSLDRDQVVFVLRVPARRLLSFDPRISSRVPAYVDSIDRVLLATGPADWCLIGGRVFTPGRTTQGAPHARHASRR